MFQLGHSEGVLWLPIYIVPKDDLRIVLMLKIMNEAAIFLDGG